MAESYFDFSQRMRKEIAGDVSLMDRVRSAFEGKEEIFAFGGTVDLFRVGNTRESGLWVALRAFRPDYNFGGGLLSAQQLAMEMYCANADELFSEGRDVPRFCVGTRYAGKAGILTEDVSANGQHEVDHPDDLPYCFVGESKRKIFIDIDMVFRYRERIELRYFAGNAVLDLD